MFLTYGSNNFLSILVSSSKNCRIERSLHGDQMRLQMICKAIVLSFLAFLAFVFIVKKDHDDARMRTISDVEFDNFLRQHFKDPSWLLPNKRSDGSYEIKNKNLVEVLRHLENISDCNKISAVHRSLYTDVSHQSSGSEARVKYLNSGWTKTVYSFEEEHGEAMAIKLLNPNGEDVLLCFEDVKRKLLEQFYGLGGENEPKDSAQFHFKMDDAGQTGLNEIRNGRLLEACRSRAKLKLMKEAYLMSLFDNENIVKLHDVCLSWEVIPTPRNRVNYGDGYPPSRTGSDDERGDIITFEDLGRLTISYSTQLGVEADLISLLQLSWEDRLRVCYGISKLLNYFSSFISHASVLINDFRRQQFVLVGGEVMMTDLDDLTFAERSCDVDDECRLGDDNDAVSMDKEWTSSIKCLDRVCHRWHDAKNTKNAATHFIGVLLPHGVPEYLVHLASEIENNFSSATWRVEENLKLVERLVKDFSSGVYLERVRESRGDKENSDQYYILEGHDQPGYHDYRCRYTRGAYGCTVSVHDEEEAKALCDLCDLCRGFVMSPLKSWTGRRYAHLKSNVTPDALRKAPEGYTLYYKLEL